MTDLHKTGKLKTEKTYVFSSGILETETPKMKNYGKLLHGKIAIVQYLIHEHVT